jgi:hypothetical protein
MIGVQVQSKRYISGVGSLHVMNAIQEALAPVGQT